MVGHFETLVVNGKLVVSSVHKTYMHKLSMQDCPKYKSIMLPSEAFDHSLHSLCITLNRSYVSSMNMLWSRTINNNISTNWSNQHSFTKHFNNIIMIAEFYHTSTNESQNRKTKTISFQLSIVTREHTNTLTTR